MQTQKRTINDVRSILGDTVQPKLLNIFYLRDDGDIIPPGITNQPDDFLGDPTIGKGFSPSRRPKENHYSLEPKNLYDVTGQRLHAQGLLPVRREYQRKTHNSKKLPMPRTNDE